MIAERAGSETPSTLQHWACDPGHECRHPPQKRARLLPSPNMNNLFIEFISSGNLEKVDQMSVDGERDGSPYWIDKFGEVKTSKEMAWVFLEDRNGDARCAARRQALHTSDGGRSIHVIH